MRQPTARDLVVLALELLERIVDLPEAEVDDALEAELGPWLNAAKDKAGALLAVHSRLTMEAGEWRKQGDALYAAAAVADRGAESVRMLARDLLLAHEAVGGEGKLRSGLGTVYLSRRRRLRRPRDIAEWGPVVKQVVVDEPDEERAQRIADGREEWTGQGPCPFANEELVSVTFRNRS